MRVEDYQRFSDLEIEEGLSRVWGGIHFGFDVGESREACVQIADYIFATKMRPL